MEQYLMVNVNRVIKLVIIFATSIKLLINIVL